MKKGQVEGERVWAPSSRASALPRSGCDPACLLAGEQQLGAHCPSRSEAGAAVWWPSLPGADPGCANLCCCRAAGPRRLRILLGGDGHWLAVLAAPS